MRVRVLTMNVQNDDGDARRVAVINEEIRRWEPDLVALQEVVRPPSRAAAAALLAETSLMVTHQADVLNFAMPFEDRYGGTVVATRWPHRIVELLDQRGEEALDVPWTTLAAVVEIPDLGELLFIATTMSWRLEAEAVRERQALAVTDLDARHRRALPSIIAGDLNADPDAASIRYLRGLPVLAGTQCDVSRRVVDRSSRAGRVHLGCAQPEGLRRRCTPSCASLVTVGDSTMCSPDPGTLTRRPAPR